MENQKKTGFSPLFRDLFGYMFRGKGKTKITGESHGSLESRSEPCREVLSSREREALKEETSRRRLHEAALFCISGNDISQQETEFARQLPADGVREGEYDLSPLGNECVFGTAARDFAPYMGSLLRPPYGNQAIRLLAGTLKETEALSVEPLDYTSPEELKRLAPETLRNGLRALTLCKVVQGPLRDQVNGYRMFNEGITAEEARDRWKKLDALTGARNGLIDILKCYSSEFFAEKGGESGGSAWHQLMSDCCCSLHFFKEELYQKLTGVPVSSLGEAQAAYMGSGGDHRAFYEVEDEQLSGFLRGEQGRIAISHRSDYLSMTARARVERPPEKGREPETEKVRTLPEAGKRLGLERLMAEEKTKTERRVGNEAGKKGTSLCPDTPSRERAPGRNPGNRSL